MSARISVKLTEYETSRVISCTYVSDGSPATHAEISYDKDWLYFTTDAHEGAAMIHIEALPMIRRVLAKIARERKAKP